MLKSKENTSKEIYKKLRKYLPRSFDGEPYATKMVNELYDKAMEHNPDIYYFALEDSHSDISISDNKILGESISKFIRVKFTPDSELDEFFSLYQESQSPDEQYRFASFCKNMNLNPDNIILFPISGNSMIGANISDGDTAIVDTSRIPKNGEIGAVFVNNKYFIKRIGGDGGKLILISENKEFQPYIIGPSDKFKYIGLVTNIVKKVVPL